jgi:hypothetical protein
MFASPHRHQLYFFKINDNCHSSTSSYEREIECFLSFNAFSVIKALKERKTNVRPLPTEPFLSHTKSDKRERKEKG